MADCIIKGGGASTPDGLTAVASLVYPGKTYVGADTDGDIGTGTMATKAAATVYATTATQNIALKDKYVTGAQTVAPITFENFSAANIRSTATVAIKSNDAVIKTVTGSFGSDATASEANILVGKTAVVGSKAVTGTMATKGATTHYATSKVQTAVPANTYLTGNQTLAAVTHSNLFASNIKHGVTVSVKNGNGNTTLWSPSGSFDTLAASVVAAASDIYTGKIGYANGAKVTGTMATKAAATYYGTASAQSIAANTYLTGNQTLAALKSTNFAASNVKSGVVMKVNNGVSDALIVTGSFSSGLTAGATDILSGKTGYVNGTMRSGTMTTKAAATFRASTSAQEAVPANTYITGNQVLMGMSVSNLVASNVKSGVTIIIGNGSGTVSSALGTFSSGLTAAAGNIVSGKIAYVNGNKVTGTLTSKAAQTYSLGSATQTIASGQYLSGTQTITGYPHLVASNIASGITLWNIAGTMQRGNVAQTLYNGSAFGGYMGGGVVVNSTRVKRTGGSKFSLYMCGKGDDATVASGSITLNSTYLGNGEHTDSFSFVSKKSIDFSKYTKVRLVGSAYTNGGGRGQTTTTSKISLELYNYARNATTYTNSVPSQNIIVLDSSGRSSDGWRGDGLTKTYDVTFDISGWTSTQGFLTVFGVCSTDCSSSSSSYYPFTEGWFEFSVTGIYIS